MEEHVLVCISSSLSNQKCIEEAALIAKSQNAKLTGLYVETPSTSLRDEQSQKQLQQNIQFVKQLGGEVEIIYGEDVSFKIVEFANKQHVTKLCIAQSQKHKKYFKKKSMLDEILSYPIDFEVIMIASNIEESMKIKQKKKQTSIWNIKDICISIGLLIVVTIIGYIFDWFGFSESSIIMIYIVGVLLTAIYTSWPGYSFISSFVSVLSFNLLFVEPLFTFSAYEKEYPVTFLVMLIVAFLTSSLAVRLKMHASQSAQVAYRTQILFDTNQLLQKAKGKHEILQTTANQLKKLLGRSIIMYPIENEKILNPYILVEDHIDQEIYLDEKKTILSFIDQNNLNVLDCFNCLYIKIHMNETIYGIIGIVKEKEDLDTFEKSIIQSIIGECSLALENEKNRKEKEEAALLASKEQLRANLLRSISHDLRTPLTSISGNASNLMNKASALDDQSKQRLYMDMYDDSMWLIKVMENILSITRFEEGKINIHTKVELMDELIEEALHHIDRNASQHMIQVEPNDELLLVKVDAKLIMQVIINIIDNAIKYTPIGSNINISTFKKDAYVYVYISDDGEGIDDEEKKHIFDMFYMGSHKIVDSKRSLGLGLSLCKSIILAHGGSIEVKDHYPKGSEFIFNLPLYTYTPEEIKLLRGEEA